MPTEPKSKLNAAMSAAEAYACSLKSIKPARVLGQYGALLRRAALIEAHDALRAIDDPKNAGIDVARLSVATRFMQAHARLIESGHRLKISQSRLFLAHAANDRAELKKHRSHEEQPYDGNAPTTRRRSGRIEYPIMSDEEIDEILRAKDVRGQDPHG